MQLFLHKLMSMAHHQKATKFYRLLIERRLAIPAEGVVEKHHIVPRCFGIPDVLKKTNVVRLTPREHYIAHLLLIRMFQRKSPERHKMVASLIAMQKRCGLDKSSKRYAATFEEWRIAQSERMKSLLTNPEFKKTLIENRKIASVLDPSINYRIAETLRGRRRPTMKRERLKLTGDARTSAQKESSIAHSNRMVGRIPWNKGKKVGRRSAKHQRQIMTSKGLFPTISDACKVFNICYATAIRWATNKQNGFFFPDSSGSF